MNRPPSTFHIDDYRMTEKTQPAKAVAATEQQEAAIKLLMRRRGMGAATARCYVEALTSEQVEVLAGITDQHHAEFEAVLNEIADANAK